jgi:hypothetical protein
MVGYHELQAFWQVEAEEPWSKSEMERRQIVAALRGLQRITLDQAVNLMAFGSFEVPPDLEAIVAPLEEIARRSQAATALFDGARVGAIRLIGDPVTGGDKSEPIPPEYFDMPRSLGNLPNSIETALEQVSMEDYMALRRGAHQRWFNVRVICRPFITWVTPYVGSINEQKRAATRAAVEALGPGLLTGPCNKQIQDEIVLRIWGDTGFKISTRYVKEMFYELRRGTKGCS